MLTLKIAGALIALALGVWMGLPGRYEQSRDEIDNLMDQPGRRRRKVKRHFTPLAWFQRNKPKLERPSRSRFRIQAPGSEDR